MNKFYVYAVFEIGKENPLYIGKCRDIIDREKQHIKDSKKPKTAFHHKLKKMLDNNLCFVFRIIETCDTEEDAFIMEKLYINKYGRSHNKTGCLLNLTDGGEGLSGFKHSIDQKKKWSEMRKGSVPPNLGKTYSHSKASPKKGKPWTTKQRDEYNNRSIEKKLEKSRKLSEANKGKSISEEQKRKHSIAMSGENNPNFGKKGYYSGKVGPNKGKLKGPDGKLYYKDELINKFGVEYYDRKQEKN